MNGPAGIKPLYCAVSILRCIVFIFTDGVPGAISGSAGMAFGVEPVHRAPERVVEHVIAVAMLAQCAVLEVTVLVSEVG